MSRIRPALTWPRVQTLIATDLATDSECFAIHEVARSGYYSTVDLKATHTPDSASQHNSGWLLLDHHAETNPENGGVANFDFVHSHHVRSRVYSALVVGHCTDVCVY